MPERLRTGARRLSGSGSAPSIGFLVDWLEDSRYHWQILRGAMKEAYDQGASFIAFVGGSLAPADQPSESNWIYQLARPGNVDALVLLSGTLGNAVGSNALATFCAQYPPIPICSIAIPLPAASSVCVDNALGMRAVIEHLIVSHGIQRIAFVRGPAANDEAEMRLRVYRDTLESSKIAYDPDLVVSGDFTMAAGREAISVLFAERKLPVSSVGAVVAANDAMATGVVDGLSRRGIRIPEQIAVAGFDDIEEARFCNPPLTTVTQRLDGQGRESIRIVMDQLRSGTVKFEHVVRSPELVTRRSCGCLSSASTSRKSSAPPAVTLGFDAALIRRRQHILTDMARAARGGFGAAGAQWDVRLLSAIADQIRGDRPDAFIRAYDDVLGRIVEAGADLAAFNDVLSALRAGVVRCVGDPKQRMRTEDLFHEARIMTTLAVERLHVARRLRAWNEARSLVQAGSSIVSAEDLDALSQAVHESLPRAGILRTFVARLDEGAGNPTARVVLADSPDARRFDPILAAPQPPTEILRSTLLRGTDEHAFAVFPAAFADQEKAIVALQLGATEGFGYEVLRQIIAGVLSRMNPPGSGAIV